MKTRVILWATVLSLAVFTLYKMDTKPAYEHIGRAVACSRRFPFQKYSQAEILEYGLQDARGLACDREGRRVFISESNRSLLIDWLDPSAGTGTNAAAALPGLEDSEPQTMCPEQSCGAADQRGLAVLDGRLFSAEHGRGQITVRALPQSRFGPGDGAKWLLSASPLQGNHELLTEPSGIAAVDHTLFVTDEPLRPFPTADGDSNDPGDRIGGTAKGAAGQSGALYACASDHCVPERVSTFMRHPSGVAAASAEGPIFVAEADALEVRWPVYEKVGGKWRETRSLGSVPISGEGLPAFLGIALDESRQMVFAAGPGGLYVFDLDGTLLGRVLFDGPVTGVATGGNRVYLAVNNILCALTLDDYSTPKDIRSTPAPQLPSKVSNPIAEQPPPKPHRPKPISETPSGKGCSCRTRVKRKPANPPGERPCGTVG